jgi:hypothetical protein
MGCSTSSAIGAVSEQPETAPRDWPGIHIAPLAKVLHKPLPTDAVTVGTNVKPHRKGRNVICIFGNCTSLASDVSRYDVMTSREADHDCRRPALQQGSRCTDISRRLWLYGPQFGTVGDGVLPTAICR